LELKTAVANELYCLSIAKGEELGLPGTGI